MPASTLARFQRITPQQLRAFEASARLLSVTQAARELFVSQPTVSVQLKELAETLGESLFEQSGRQIRLTQAGELLYQTVRELASCWQRLESELAAIHGLVRGKLKIAAVTTAEYFVPDLLGPFARAYPGIEIELSVENRDRIVQRLSQGLDDLTVMMLPPAELDLDSQAFQTNNLIVIAPANHPLSNKKLRLNELSGERWLMREAGSGTRKVTEQFFAKQQFQPNIMMSLGSNEAIKHAVAAGLGIAVLSDLAVNQPAWSSTTNGLRILDVADFPIVRQWYLVWRRDTPQSATARGFIAYLQQQASG
ncbi:MULTISPECIES: LysR family transcriptional regulator [Alishewanella]|uniref:NdhF3 operon transcriptional regulator n=2 Tax=Alishewanella TaxID=111142 RepID=H3ZI55_9ALTE|nr:MULTISPECIES: LysR family transcriptional regulator [Alishewanella]EHR39697.1 ndhF3 operon transcriptional regulator [Alishewanella jeotgali KCTC 22429]EJI85829.1 ndhF3 operon transcriptional regulator [Alishewanella aestuarii B11]